MDYKEANDYLEWLRSLNSEQSKNLIKSCKVRLPSDDSWKRAIENRFEKAWRRQRSHSTPPYPQY